METSAAPARTIFENSHKMNIDKQETARPRRKYPVEFKLDIIRQARSAEHRAIVARRYNVPEQTLSNWFKAEKQGKLSRTMRDDPPEDREMLEKIKALNPGYRREMERTLTALLRLQYREEACRKK